MAKRVVSSKATGSFKSAITGKYVSKDTAQRFPKTTYRLSSSTSKKSK